MKKINFLFLLVLVLPTLLVAQTQRMVMYEGFSQASCSPCASANPTINSLLNSNETKVVGIKYQTNWPGTDPMNTQTQTWVGPRVTYYGVNAVPDTRVNGVDQDLTQTNINTQYAITSPFFMTVAHNFINASCDSVHVEVTITAAQDFTGTQMVCQLAMIEKQITFTSAPGTNGETSFHRVMRKMYPNASGTTLVDSWTNGQTQTIEFDVPVPTYVYDISQIAFVSWIQSNSNKAVHQAAKSEPTTVDNYVNIVSNNLPIYPSCITSVDVTVGAKNQGTSTITSLNVDYGLLGQAVQTMPWTGSIAPGATANIVIPNIPLVGANPIVFVELKNPNGLTEYPSINMRIEKVVNAITTYNAAPITQAFSTSTFPPVNYSLVNPDNDATWSRSSTIGGFGQTPAGSAKMDYYSSPSGKNDYFYLPPVDLSGFTAVNLVFDVAYARYDATYSDRLYVQVSTNCGQTWTSKYDKSGTTLATAPDVTTAFSPTAAQWRTETVDLNTVAGQSEVLIRYWAKSGYGNYLYIDNINLDGTTSLSNISLNSNYKMYPNPASSLINIETEQNSSIVVVDLLGKEVLSSLTSSQMHQMDVNGLQNGTYIVKITNGNQTFVEKLIINK